MGLRWSEVQILSPRPISPGSTPDTHSLPAGSSIAGYFCRTFSELLPSAGQTVCGFHPEESRSATLPLSNPSRSQAFRSHKRKHPIQRVLHSICQCIKPSSSVQPNNFHHLSLEASKNLRADKICNIDTRSASPIRVLTSGFLILTMRPGRKK